MKRGETWRGKAATPTPGVRKMSPGLFALDFEEATDLDEDGVSVELDMRLDEFVAPPPPDLDGDRTVVMFAREAVSSALDYGTGIVPRAPAPKVKKCVTLPGLPPAPETRPMPVPALKLIIARHRRTP